MASQRKPIRVAVADSNQMASRLLSEALDKQPGFSVVSSDASGESLLRSVQSLKPDIAVISAALPDGPLNLNSRAEENLCKTPQCPWILLLDHSEPQLVVAAFRAGARGVFSRMQSDINMLAKCVRRVMEGQIWVDNEQTLYLLQALNASGDDRHDHDSAPNRLTPREESVVRLVLQGMVNREIADTLHLSQHTIKNYLFNIFDKLGVSNRVELVLYATAKLSLAHGSQSLSPNSQPSTQSIESGESESHHRARIMNR